VSKLNKFEISLLQKAYQNYLQTGVHEGTFQPKNGDDWFYNSDALKQLEDNGYIEVDENFNPDKISLPDFGQPIHYSLTTKGIAYVKENLKP
jgi:hypothetical protein